MTSGLLDVTVGPRARNPWPARIVAALVVVGIVMLAVFGGWWLTHDRALTGGGSIGSGPAPVGDTIYADLGVYPAPGEKSKITIDISSLRLRTTVNTAGASVAVVYCAMTPSGGVGVVGSADIKKECSSLTPFTSGSIMLGRQPLLVAITPKHAGTVVVDGVDIHYRHGLRYGSQHVGPMLTTTTR